MASVSPDTNLSLTVSVNLHLLTQAFDDLESNHQFYTDPGCTCCCSCAKSEALSHCFNDPYVFWSAEQEDFAHSHPKDTMEIYYGSRDDRNPCIRNDIKDIITSVLDNHGIKYYVDHEDDIYVYLNTEKPCLDKGDPDNDYLNVELFIPKNSETEEYCENDLDEYDSENEDLVNSYSFFKDIDDGESLKTTVYKIDPSVRKHIGHYRRNFNRNGIIYPVEDAISVYEEGGHGIFSSLSELLEEYESCFKDETHGVLP